MQARDREDLRDGRQLNPDQLSPQSELGRVLGYAEEMHQLFNALSDRLENAISKRLDGIERNQQNRRSVQNDNWSEGNEESVSQARRDLTRPATSLPERQSLGLADCTVNPREGSVTSIEQGSVPRGSSSASMDRRPAEDIVDAINLQNYERVERFEGKSYIEYTTFIRQFDRQVGDTNIREKYKLDYLIKLCAPPVREMIMSSSLLDESEGYKSARTILHQRYGQQDLYLHEVIAGLADGPEIKGRDGMAMRKLADEYFRAMQTVKSAGQAGILSHSYVTARIVARLPNAVLERYHAHAADIRGSRERFMNAEEIHAFLDRQAQVMLHGSSRSVLESRDHRSDRRAVGLTTGGSMVCPLCEDSHSLMGCRRFRGMTVQERFEWARKERLCFLCLKGKHLATFCNSGFLPCDIGGCGRRHARLLHMASTETLSLKKRPRSEDDVQEGVAENARKKGNGESSSFGASSSKGREEESVERQ